VSWRPPAIGDPSLERHASRRERAAGLGVAPVLRRAEPLPAARARAIPDTPMRIESDVKLDFKDVLIRPKRSTLGSRSDVDVNRTFRFLHTGSEWSGFPLIAANMDVTGTMAMARALGKRGALTALHKHYPEDELAKFFAGEDGVHAFYSLGAVNADLAKLAAVRKRAQPRLLCIDVANGYFEKFLDVVRASARRKSRIR
jgi:GMP reductase